MGVHESSVNYANLIRDLAEMYPFDVAEVVVVELVANCLDAKAKSIHITLDTARKRLVVEDDGEGMEEGQFEQYHDFAVGLKTRGEGIGFAGVGAKISFNIAERVLTETRSRSFRGASDWHFVSRGKLVWEDATATHLSGHGTRVEVRFRPDARLPYSSRKDIVRLLRRHYLPLFDGTFLDLYARLGIYLKRLRFVVNGEELRPGDLSSELRLESVREFFPRRGTTRIGYGVLGVAAEEYPAGADLCGVVICTRGKVVKGELFSQFPGELGTRIFGVVEVPPLVKMLTTAKNDFMRGRRYREFERLYGPIREEFRDWLKGLGIHEPEEADKAESASLERELRRIVEEVPELGELLGFRTRRDVLTRGGEVAASQVEGVEGTFSPGDGAGHHGPAPPDVGDQPGVALVSEDRGAEKARSISRKARRGPKITFAEAPDRTELAWAEGNTVVINSGHSCYTKMRSHGRARRLHCLFAIACAVQRLLASEGDKPDLGFVDRMMKAWGEA
jgi:hypothetical protein